MSGPKKIDWPKKWEGVKKDGGLKKIELSKKSSSHKKSSGRNKLSCKKNVWGMNFLFLLGGTGSLVVGQCRQSNSSRVNGMGNHWM